MRWSTRRLPLCLAWLVAAVPLAGQEPRVLTGVEPAEVTVGEHFRTAVRVELPPGTTALFGELDLSGPLEHADTPRVVREEGAATVVFTLVLWRAEEPEPRTVQLRVIGPGEVERRAGITLRMPAVRSVLPAGEVQPRPTRGVLSSRRSGVRWLALLALLIAVAGAAAAWRHARGDRASVQETDSRRAALAELKALEEEGLIEAAEWEAFYVRLTAILRRSLAERSPEMGRALTTEELLARLDEVEPAARDRMARLLSGADRVKFGRGESRSEQALDDLEAVRRWLGGPAAHG